MLAAGAVAGIFDALEFLDRRLFDFADYPAERYIAVEPDTGFDDRLNGDQSGGKAALHIVGAEPPDPAVTHHGFRLEAFADQIILFAAIGSVHMAGEQQIRP